MKITKTGLLVVAALVLFAAPVLAGDLHADPIAGKQHDLEPSLHLAAEP